MKKLTAIFVFVFVLILQIFLPQNSVVYASTERSIEKYGTLDIYSDLVSYVYGENIDDNKRVDRTVGSKGELSAAEYIKDAFEGLGYEPLFDEYITEYTATYSFSSQITSVNVSALKRASGDSNKLVIIGAHIDNTYNFSSGNEVTKSHGIYDNASGVVAMLNVAKILKDIDLDYNVVFVGFGGEELGSLGAEAFITKLSQDAKDNLLLMINFDAIGAGEYMYIYCDEVQSSREGLFRDVASQYSSKYTREEVSNNPTLKKTNYTSVSGDIEYTHMGLSSDNGLFLSKGYSAITFFSGNWHDINKTGIVESSGEEVYHTAKDNLKYLDDRYGETFYNRIEDVIEITVNTMLQPDFIEVLEKDTNKTYLFFTKSTWVSVICVAVVAIVVMAINFVLIKRRPRVVVHNDEELKQAVLNNDIEKLGQLSEIDVEQEYKDRIKELNDRVDDPPTED